MKMSNASQLVLVGLLAIALFELGVTGKFAQVWGFAFTNQDAKAVDKTTPGSEPQLHPGTSSGATTTTTTTPPTATQTF